MRAPCLLALFALLACGKQEKGGARWLTEPTLEQHDKFFPIAAWPHATTCNDCHGTSDSFKGFECTGCHTAPETTPLHAGEPAYAFASPACYACHPRGTGTLVPAAHATYFPIAPSDPHAYGKAITVAGQQRHIDCASCHVDAAARPNVDCTGCHLPAGNGAAHDGKVGRTQAGAALWLGSGPVGDGTGASARCLECHAAGTRDAGFVATHGLAGSAKAVFDIAASNRNHFVSCEACHTATFTAPSRKNPERDFARASCDACHAATGTSGMSSIHATIGVPLTQPYAAGDPANSAACLTCHPNGGSAVGFAHPWFPIAAAAVHNSGVARCADCHADTTTYSGPPAANLDRISCDACHDDTAANLPNQRGVTLTAAHGRTRVGRDLWNVPGGMQYVPSPTTAANPLATCLNCHAGNIGGAVASFSTPLVFRLTQHDVHCSLGGKGIVSGDRTHNVDRNTDISLVNTCNACHNRLVGTGDTPWARDWSYARQADGCVQCHEHRDNSPAPTIVCR